MESKYFKVLEFNKIKDLLKEELQSDIALDDVEKLNMYNDIDECRKLQEETADALTYIYKYGLPKLDGVSGVKMYTKRAKLGSMLFPADLLKIAKNLNSARMLKSFIKDREEDSDKFPLVYEFIKSLRLAKELEDNINSAILTENEISDNASRELRSIRRQIKNKNDAIREKMNSYLNNESTKKYLQDSIITVREGRYVLPVKNDMKSKIEGMVHDISSKGTTAFIEPMAVVKMNNELKELLIKEDEEVERILYSLSSKVSEEADTIERNEDILHKLVFMFAKASLAKKMRGTKPLLNEKGEIVLKNARHPLIDKEKVVALSLELGYDYTTLIITGPNTGGKTVTLKTLGLLSIMAQSGLHVPCDEGSVFNVFDRIFADIGDEQSIEQSLSTFSSHMTNIVYILSNCEYNNLVLLDELGAGTDPLEGASLAIAILDKLLSKKIRVMATTHYSELKHYALTKKGVENASMEFDINTLSPTYNLIVGIPGKSNAFEISKRLGLSDKIIEKASSLLSKDNVEFEDVLKAIEEDRITIRKQKEEILNRNKEIEKLRANLEIKNKKIEEKREELLKKAAEEAREIIRKTKNEASFIIQELKDIENLKEKQDRRRLQEAKEYLKDLESKSGKISESKNVRTREIPKNLDIGDIVRVVSLDKVGEVISLPDAKGELDIQVGLMLIHSNIKNLELSEAEDMEEKKSSKVFVREKSKNVSKEIDIRGMNVEEAILELDKYIDDAFIARFNNIRIIHGKGTGLLRKGVRDYLQKNKRVKNIKKGAFNEGGDGVTVAELYE